MEPRLDNFKHLQMEEWRGLNGRFGRTTWRQYNMGWRQLETWLNGLYVKHLQMCQASEETKSICLRWTRYEEYVIFIAGEITKQRRKISNLCPALC